MEVTGLRHNNALSRKWLVGALTVVLSGSVAAQSETQAAGYLDQLRRVATSLTAGHAADAIAAFDASCPQRQQLQSYFEALSNVRSSRERREHELYIRPLPADRLARALPF